MLLEIDFFQFFIIFSRIIIIIFFLSSSFITRMRDTDIVIFKNTDNMIS